MMLVTMCSSPFRRSFYTLCNWLYGTVCFGGSCRARASGCFSPRIRSGHASVAGLRRSRRRLHRWRGRKEVRTGRKPRSRCPTTRARCTVKGTLRGLMTGMASRGRDVCPYGSTLAASRLYQVKVGRLIPVGVTWSLPAARGDSRLGRTRPAPRSGGWWLSVRRTWCKVFLVWLLGGGGRARRA